MLFSPFYRVAWQPGDDLEILARGTSRFRSLASYLGAEVDRKSYQNSIREVKCDWIEFVVFVSN